MYTLSVLIFLLPNSEFGRTNYRSNSSGFALGVPENTSYQWRDTILPYKFMISFFFNRYGTLFALPTYLNEYC